MRQVVFALLAVLAAVLICVLRQDPPAPNDGLAVQSVAPSAETGPDEHSPADTAVESTNAPARNERAAGPEAPPAEPGSGPEPAPVLLSGRVLLIDASGAELGGLDGEITLRRWKGRGAKPAVVAVTNGAFEVDVTGYEVLTVHSLSLGGRGAVPEDPGCEFLLDRGPIVVRAIWPRVLRLNVLSEATGEHLSGITLLTSRHGSHDDRRHPGLLLEGDLLLTDGLSPLEIVPSPARAAITDTTYYVHSPGCAWKPIHVDLSRGGEREVRLEWGGDVEFRVVGELPAAGAFLRLRRDGESGSTLWLEHALRGVGPVEFTGLPAAGFVASVELGYTHREPLVLVETAIEVAAGERRSWELFLAPPAEEVFAGLAGTLVVPREWKLPSFRLTAEAQSTLAGGGETRHQLERADMEAIASEEDAWAFDFGAIPTGTYVLELDSLGHPAIVRYPIRVRVDPGGLWNVRLELPPPGTAVVRLVDAVTGQTAAIEHLMWTPEGPRRDGLPCTVSRAREEGQDHFEFSATLGEVELGTLGEGYVSLRETVQIHPGSNEFTFPLQRECPLVIRLADGETPVPFLELEFPKIEHLDGEGKLLWIRWGDGTFNASLSEPGRYLFQFANIPGFEPVPPQTIEVQRGVETEHVIQLVREQ